MGKPTTIDECLEVTQRTDRSLEVGEPVPTMRADTGLPAGNGQLDTVFGVDLACGFVRRRLGVTDQPVEVEHEPAQRHDDSAGSLDGSTPKYARINWSIVPSSRISRMVSLMIGGFGVPRLSAMEYCSPVLYWPMTANSGLELAIASAAGVSISTASTWPCASCCTASSSLTTTIGSIVGLMRDWSRSRPLALRNAIAQRSAAAVAGVVIVVALRTSTP